MRHEDVRLHNAYLYPASRPHVSGTAQRWRYTLMIKPFLGIAHCRVMIRSLPSRRISDHDLPRDYDDVAAELNGRVN